VSAQDSAELTGTAKQLPLRERSGIALCLSGGGYRAALFHLGALRRLNELGALGRIDTICGVSGGSIVAAFLAQRVGAWPPSGVIEEFEEGFAKHVRDFTKNNIRTKWILRRLIRPWDSTVAVESLASRYEKDVVQLKLPDLPELPKKPRFIFCATDMAFGINWVFERDRVGSYIPGYVRPAPSDWPVARAVAASSCFPPVFEPLPVRLDPARFKSGQKPAEGEDRAALIRGLRLTDGGVYDNMGLEPVWRTHDTVLVSDGGATFDFKPDRGILSPFKRLSRYTAIQGRQSGAVRKRWLISNFDADILNGTYWGIGSATTSYKIHADGGYSMALSDQVVSEVRTDLDAFSDAEAEVLQNHGYLLADAAMQTHVKRLRSRDAPPAHPPFPRWIGDEDTVRRALAGSNKRKLLGRRYR